ncbi:MAG: hypothetical protein K2M13_09920 [Muribaculaceae bacterium]|nr:hypothetical protein [Muribaculaceae bacterium]
MRLFAVVMSLLLLFPCGYLAPEVKAQTPETPASTTATPDSTEYLDLKVMLPTDREQLPDLSDTTEAADTLKTVVEADDYPYGLEGKKPFNPSPDRAIWLSALCPGLGQIYNRRYWKLPIVVGGFMGLAYATSWNNSQYQDYVQAYRDITDADPDTKSYMNFFPPTTNESDLDPSWLTQTFKSKKDYFRRNRDLCIICVVAFYLVCMLDAYVDASMAHFDISPSLSMDVAPTLMIPRPAAKPSLGLTWALNF